MTSQNKDLIIGRVVVENHQQFIAPLAGSEKIDHRQTVLSYQGRILDLIQAAERYKAEQSSRTAREVLEAALEL